MNGLRVVTKDDRACRDETAGGIGGGGESALERTGGHAGFRTAPRDSGRQNSRRGRWMWRIHPRTPLCPIAG